MSLFLLVNPTAVLGHLLVNVICAQQLYPTVVNWLLYLY